MIGQRPASIGKRLKDTDPQCRRRRPFRMPLYAEMKQALRVSNGFNHAVRRDRDDFQSARVDKRLPMMTVNRAGAQRARDIMLSSSEMHFVRRERIGKVLV